MISDTYAYEDRNANVSSARLRAVNFSFLTQCFDCSDRSLESSPLLAFYQTRVDVVGVVGLAGLAGLAGVA